ncbi:MAG: peptide ABC transporter substrate-binding protein [Geminicoccaceae bacterium]|nr:MAG: peptide ABC transporter substrate-binding protein [Geminicoccaceae bacterium]
MVRWLLAGLLLVALGATAPVAARDTLRIGVSQFPSTLHPSIDSMLAKTYVRSMTLRPFTGYGPDWELRCFLCTELPTLENGLAERIERDDGSVGVKLTYTINPDATWGDGVPVTTDDVLFTWRSGKHPESGVANREVFTNILDIEVHDSRTFTLEVDKLRYNYNAINGFLVLPAHVEAEVFDAAPATYRNRTRFDTDPTHPGLAFGPYRVVEVRTGEYIVLERNPTWHGTTPAFQRIIVQTIENTPALEANLLAGSLDMIAGELGLPLEQAIAFEQRHGARFQVHYETGLIYEHLEANLDNPIFQDRRVRQALLYAVDRQAMTDRLFDGRQPVALTNVHPMDWVHDETVPTFARDVERAKALLEEAGWTPGRDGVRVNGDGVRFSFEFSTTAGNRSRELVQQFLQAQWAEVGIEAIIRNLPPRVLFAEHLSRRQFTGMALFAWISSPESPPKTTLHSSMIPSAENAWSGQNYTGFANAEVDALIEAIEVELDREARAQLWSRLQYLYATELPALPLFFRANPHVWPLWLEGVTPTGHQDISTLFVEYWRVAD